MTQPLLGLDPITPAEYQNRREFERTGQLPMVSESELLRIGMAAGRAMIEQQRAPRRRKDTRTLSMFDTKEMF